MAVRPTLADFRFSDGLCLPYSLDNEAQTTAILSFTRPAGKVRTVGFQQYKCR